MTPETPHDELAAAIAAVTRDSEPSPDELIERLAKIMRHVAKHTRDQWARDYIIQRLNDFGFHCSFSNPVETLESTRP